MSQRFIRDVLIRLGVPPRPAGNRRSAVHDTEVARRYQAGETALSIAESLPISLSTVRRIQDRQGIPRHPAGQLREKVDDARANRLADLPQPPAL